MMRRSIPAGTRRWPIIVIAVVVLLFIIFTVMSGFYVDLLWFREVNLAGVFWTVLRTKAVLGLIFGLLFFALLYVNLLIVRWLTPTTRILTPEQEAVERFRQTLEPAMRWLIPVGTAVLALIVGIGASHQWQAFLLWRNGSGLTFGHPEPLFHRDPAFYVFSLPWLRFVSGWVFNALVGVTLIVAIAHFLWGGIQPQAPALADKVAPPVRAHLSVLLGLILLAKAWGYYLGRFDLLTSPRGVVEGASYTDVHAQLPALNFLAIAAVICAGLFFLNVRLRNWALPILGVGLLAVVSVLLGTAYPAFVQQFQVKPQEQQRETPYIRDNIQGTQLAFGLDQINVSERPVDTAITAKALANNSPTVSNIRLWRPAVLGENFQSLQRIQPYYDFNDVDVDRYDLSGERRVLMVAAREVDQTAIPGGGGNWQNQHLVYTHGFGAVAAQVNTASAEGAPLFTVQNIPPVGQPTISQPRLYYGETEKVPFVVVKTSATEIDYETGTAGPKQTYSYTGTGGIPMGNFFQRALFAWRYKDINLLISGLIHADSRIMINRDLATRASLPAPFLTFDGDPYLAMVDGRLKWIWDAYTTTTEYPYSQSVDLAKATDGGIPGGQANYMRNSVKVVVDAYDGSITYYDVSGGTDPILQAWSLAFPGMFTPVSQAPANLVEHFRYPENLFQVQATQFATYHVTDPAIFFQKKEVWQIPDDPTIPANAGANASATGAMHPYYSLMRLPGAADEQFQLILPFTPANRQNMVAWMAASSDPGSYGNITAYTFPAGRNVDGPTQVFAQINQDPGFSAQRTLLGTGGSTVIFGDFLVIPIDDSLLYVQPVYVRSTQASSIPELKRVVVVNGGVVGVGSTLESALAQSTTGQPTGGGKPPTGSVDQQIAGLLNQATQAFAAADTALHAGDLATYQQQLAQAQSLVQQASALAAQQTASGGSSGTPTPSPSP
jgi:hypothetical protein